jgi:acetyltransferase-like isoleucine patch superfamily enzyme
MKTLLQLLALLLPWPLRRRVLVAACGFRIHPASRIGLAWVAPGRLILEEGASIGHFTVCKGLDLVHLGAHASIGRGNWITGLSAHAAVAGEHFAHQPGRVSALILGAHAAITHRHLIDCTDCVTLGARTTFAGFRSQILTHSIDLARNRQHAAPVTIGAACFVGTGVIILAGSVLPDCSVLGAGSLLNKAHEETHRLYAGVPARSLSALDPSLAYFHRTTGFVV